ncbi:MAG TPA: hypothetical protein PK333_01750 [Candidatus Moranbacteria bacterium]|jgi:hypothetical protein|nr:hypothetical protein [Candidatus Moranbacteria bacterium]
MKEVIKFFDKFEDKIRAWLSHSPIFYALVGGMGVVIFWRGIWHTMDAIVGFLNKQPITDSPWWDGPLSVLIGIFILLLTGLMVSTFIGNEIIISGIKGEKKITEKTEIEIQEEMEEVENIKKEIKKMAVDLAEIKEKIR